MAPERTFDELLADCRESAVHLEMRDGYSRTSDAFLAWQRDPAIDPLRWYGVWLDTVRAAVDRGVTIRRARIVSEPISDYIRYEHQITEALNCAAGEDVRWLPRRRASDLALPGNDFWLFDDRVVQLNHFSGTGDSTGHENSSDPALVALCAASFAAVWKRAVPHRDYRPS